MFFPLPLKLHDGREFSTMPVANSWLIAINVLIFCAGWHPVVGPGTGFTSVVTYSFGHAHLTHLAGNMLVLLVFGMSLNRRIGNMWYLALYLGTAITVGVFARLLSSGDLLGASGAVFAVIAATLILMPSATILVGYFALFPVTLIAGLFQPPRHWVDWFIRWDTFSIRAWWGLFLVPLLEIIGLFGNGLNWTNLGHLLGMACGVGVVLLMPPRITLRTEWAVV